MGYELNKLMNQYGVSSPTLAYSGAAMPVKPADLPATSTDVEKQKYADLLAKYNSAIPQHQADKAIHDKYKAEYQMRLEKTPMYGQKQFSTLANIPTSAPSVNNPIQNNSPTQVNNAAQVNNPAQAANPEQMVKNAYASVGRQGFGNDAQQIDPEGYNYWLNQINTGVIKPEDFSKVFQNTVTKYLDTKPDDKYSQHINQFRGMQDTGSYWNSPLKVPTYPTVNPSANPTQPGVQIADQPTQLGSNLGSLANSAFMGMPKINGLAQNYNGQVPNEFNYDFGKPIDLARKYSDQYYAKGGSVKKYADGGEVEDDEPMMNRPISGSSVPSRSEMYLKLAAALASPTKTGGMGETLGNAARTIGEFKQAEREGVQKDEVNARLRAMQQLQNQKIQMELEARKRKQLYNQQLTKLLSAESAPPAQAAPVEMVAEPGLPPAENSAIMNLDLPEERNIPFADMSRAQAPQAQPAMSPTVSQAETLRGQGIQNQINKISGIIKRLDDAKLVDENGLPASDGYSKQLVELYKNMPRYSLNSHPMMKGDQPILTLIGDDGFIKETQYQPVDDVTYQDVGNKVLGKSKRTGKTISEDAKGVSPDTNARIAAGRTSGSGSTLNIDPSVVVDDETSALLAQQALAGDTSIYTGLSPRSRVKVRQSVAALAKERGMNGADIAALNAEYGGTKASQRTIGTKMANAEMAGQEALNLMPIALGASELVKRSSFLPWGKVESMFNNQTNDPNYRRFVAANNSLVNVYARAISPTGVGTESDKHHAREMLSSVYDHKSYLATVDMMEKEIEAALAAPKHVKEAISKSVRGTSQSKEPEKKYEGFKLIGVK